MEVSQPSSLQVAATWKELPLSDLYEFKNGVNADKGAYGRGVPFINVLEPITHSHLQGNEISGLVSLTPLLSATYEVRAGDLVFNRTSEIAEEVGLSAVYLGSERVVFGGFVIRGRPLGAAIDSSFAAYALRAPAVRSQIIAMGQGAVRANIGQDNLRRVVLRFPDLEEQHAISQALTDADALIDSLEQLLTKKRQIKQGAMQELLSGKRRLPGFSQPWIRGPFGSLVVQSRERINPNSLSEPPICIELEHLQPGTGRLIRNGFESQQAATKSVFRRGDVLFGKLRAYQRKCWMADFDGVCSTEIWVLRPKGELASAKFLFYSVQRDDFIEATSTAYGTHMPRSDWKVVSEFELALPLDPSEQEAIARVILDMDHEMDALESRLTKARDLKQAMAQALLTGRIRLPVENPT